MTYSIQEYNRLEDSLTRNFNKGIKAYETGHPCPMVETPERYGWLAAQKMKGVYLGQLEECKRLMLPLDLELYLKKQLSIPANAKERATLSQACVSEERSLLLQIETLMERIPNPDSPEARRLDLRLKKVRALIKAIADYANNKVQFLPMHSERA